MHAYKLCISHCIPRPATYCIAQVLFGVTMITARVNRGMIITAQVSGSAIARPGAKSGSPGPSSSHLIFIITQFQCFINLVSNHRLLKFCSKRTITRRSGVLKCSLRSGPMLMQILKQEVHGPWRLITLTEAVSILQCMTNKCTT